MNAVDAAIYGALSGDATLTGLAPGGIHRVIAPYGATYPLVIFGKAGATDTYTLSTRAFRDLVYLIKAVGTGLSGGALNDILARVDILLTDVAITISGATLMYLRRSRDIGDYEEEAEGGVRYQYVGAYYNVTIR